MQIKKYRQQEQSFVVEGEKSVLELLSADFQITLLVGTPDFQDRNRLNLRHYSGEIIEAKPDELTVLGAFKTNESALAVVRMNQNLPLAISNKEFVLVLDDIRDPGNLGTIIRIADWYGITKIIASEETADLYNPKTVHASMGSFTRVRLYYTNLVEFLAGINLPIFGTFLDGDNIHGMDWGEGAVIVIGNEAHGISPPVEKRITKRITIPKFGGAESLNAAIATAVICDNIRRK